MPWGALIAALIQFLGPLALEWLKKLLESLPERELAPNDATAVRQVFAAARRNMSWGDRLRLRGWVLERAERACLAHAAGLGLAARGAAPAPVLGETDRELFGL